MKSKVISNLELIEANLEAKEKDWPKYFIEESLNLLPDDLLYRIKYSQPMFDRVRILVEDADRELHQLDISKERYNGLKIVEEIQEAIH